MKKYDVAAGPVFVVTDSNFKNLSRSPYGFLDIAAFTHWLTTGESRPPSGEVRALSELLPKGHSKAVTDYDGLYEYFDELTSKYKDEERKKILSFIPLASEKLSAWSKTPFSKDEAYGNYYRLSLSFWKLAILAEKTKTLSGHPQLERALELNRKIQSSDLLKNLGRHILEIWILIRMKKDNEVKSLVQKITQLKPDNWVLLYGSLAYGYLEYQKDCSRVMYYTDKIPFQILPVETERMNIAYLRFQCYGKQKDLKSAEKDYALLQEHLSPEIKKAFPKKFERIQKIMNELRSQPNL